MKEQINELEQAYSEKVNQYKQLEREILFMEGQLSVLRQLRFEERTDNETAKE